MSKKNENLTLTIAKYINKYFGGTIEQGVGIVEDKLHYIRWEKQIKLFDQANAILKSRGVETIEQIPQKLMLPLLEAATLEENDYLEEKWAKLLANAADKKRDINVKRNYISILENMTAYEFILLGAIAKHDCNVNLANYPDEIITKTTNPEPPNNETEIAMNNLGRLGLLYIDNPFTPIPTWVRLSALGKEFYKACN